MREQFNSVAVATTMTSLQIAEVTGKNHKHVLRSIRSMEPAWEKVNGTKFGLVEYTDAKGEKRPMYSLTKTECLYVATKFNDEARAKLVLRWEALEKERLNPALPSVEEQNIILVKGLQAAKYHNEKLQKELEWEERRNSRLLDKVFLEQKHPRFEFEQANMNSLLKAFDECCDLMWDCVRENMRMAARVSMLEKKLGMYEPIPEDLIYEKGGVS